MSKTKTKLTVFNFENREELGKKKIFIDVEGEQKEITVPKMKVKQIFHTLKVATSYDWSKMTYEQIVDFAMQIAPDLIGITKEEFENVAIEDLEALVVHFEENNQYFLGILDKRGILTPLKSVIENFGTEVQSISEKSELDTNE